MNGLDIFKNRKSSIKNSQNDIEDVIKIKDANQKLILEKRKLEKELGNLYEREIQQLPFLSLECLERNKTVLVIIDMINGFTREGNLQSVEIEKIIPIIARITECFAKYDIPIIAFSDEHDENCPEFKTYPIHCVKGSNECELVNEIKYAGDGKIIKISKNSTNGYLENDFQVWLKENTHIKNFLISGDCTDICITAFAESIQAHFNRLNTQNVRVIVPSDLTATFDTPDHNSKFKHFEALQILKSKGIEVFSKTIFN